MVTLATDAVRTYEDGAINSLPIIAAGKIFEGAAVGDNASGFARPLVAGDPFRGFALRKVDNAAGAAGDKRIEVRTRGYAELSITALAITDVGKDVFASDDDTFTLTQGANTRIGYVHRWVATGKGIVGFNASSGVLTELTDSSGGTASDTIADAPAAYAEATTANSWASFAAKINALIRRLGN